MKYTIKSSFTRCTEVIRLEHKGATFEAEIASASTSAPVGRHAMERQAAYDCTVAKLVSLAKAHDKACPLAAAVPKPLWQGTNQLYHRMENARRTWHSNRAWLRGIRWDFVGGSAHGRAFALEADLIHHDYKVVTVNGASPLASYYPGRLVVPPGPDIRTETYIPCFNPVLLTYGMVFEPVLRGWEGEEIQPNGSNAWRQL